jgi:hypothetical protein
MFGHARIEMDERGRPDEFLASSPFHNSKTKTSKCPRTMSCVTGCVTGLGRRETTMLIACGDGDIRLAVGHENNYQMDATNGFRSLTHRYSKDKDARHLGR